MNWEVLTRDVRPEDVDERGRLPERCAHIRVAGDTESLCHAVNVVDDRWLPEPETHPEDVGSLDRCSVCYSVYERRFREERGLDPLPSRHLPNTAARRRYA